MKLASHTDTIEEENGNVITNTTEYKSDPRENRTNVKPLFGVPLHNTVQTY
jgi:hypothetical protein